VDFQGQMDSEIDLPELMSLIFETVDGPPNGNAEIRAGAVRVIADLIQTRFSREFEKVIIIP
jgi:hypothetical protein